MSSVQTPQLKISSYSQAPGLIGIKLKTPLLSPLYLGTINLTLITSSTPVGGYVTVGHITPPHPVAGQAYLQVNAATYAFIESKLNTLGTQPFTLQLTYDRVTLAVTNISTMVVATSLAMESSLRELIQKLTPNDSVNPAGYSEAPSAYSEPPASEDELQPYHSNEEQSPS